MTTFSVYEDEGMIALVVAPDADTARTIAAEYVGGYEPEELWSLDTSEVEPLLGDVLPEGERVIADERDLWRHGIREEDQRACDECGIPHAPIFGVSVCPGCNRCVVTIGGLDFNECGHLTECGSTVQVHRG